VPVTDILELKEIAGQLLSNTLLIVENKHRNMCLEFKEIAGQF
jgi:hypothetical protein